MVNKKNNDNDEMKEFEEEFDFDSDDLSQDELSIEEDDVLNPSNTPAGGGQSSKQNISLDKKSSKLPLLIILSALGFVGWQGYQFLFTGPTDDLNVPATATPSEAATPPSTTAPIIATLPPTQANQPTTEPTPVATPVPPPKTPDLFTPPAPAPAPAPAPKIQQLAALEESFKKSQERINTLESKFSELMDSMATLNQGMGQVTRELSSINGSVQKLNKDFKALKTHPQTKTQTTHTQGSDYQYEPKAITPTPSVSHSPTMRVHAIIPGRAWLKTKDGSTLTVTEGDSLEHYGKVLVIDAAHGVVITSSGMTLR